MKPREIPRITNQQPNGTAQRDIDQAAFLSGNYYPSAIAIYPECEMWHDACGTGFIAAKKDLRSKTVLELARSALVSMELRGGCCADGRTGDGAGILLEIDPKILGCERGLGVGTVFFPKDEFLQKAAREIIYNVVAEQSQQFAGLSILSWRKVPVNPNYLGELALRTCPAIEQVFVSRPAGLTFEQYESLLYKINRSCAARFGKDKIAGASIASFSSHIITYKALTNSRDLFDFYQDIGSKSGYQTRLAIIHRRQATNETTDWQRVHPNTLTAHNGEINAVRGNTECMISREAGLGLMAGELITPSGVTDSFRFDLAVAGLLHRTNLGARNASKRLSSLIALLIPGAGRKSDLLDRLSEAWDGPAAIIFTDGKYEIGAALDRNGLRPLHYQETTDFVMASSEAGVFNFNSKEILKKGRLGAGEGVKFDLVNGTELVLYEANSESADLFETVEENTQLLGDIPAEEREVLSGHAVVPKAELKFMQKLFGYTDEDIKEHIHSMVTEAKEALGGMGYTARIAGLSNHARSFFDYIFHEFAQVSNPPWDYLREKTVADLSVYIGRQPNIFLEDEVRNPSPAIKLKSPVLSLAQMEKLKQLMTDEPGTAIRSITICSFFSRALRTNGLKSRIETLVNEAEDAIDAGYANIIVSDRSASFENPPIPSVLILGAIRQRLLEKGKRMHASLIVETGEVKTAHDLAALVSYGASAVCPYNALAEARHRDYGTKYGSDVQTPAGREDRLIKSLETGLLKIMSKMGISVARSYVGSGQHFPMGLADEVSALLGNARSPIKGIGFDQLADDILHRTETSSTDRLEKGGLWREASAFAGYTFDFLKSFWRSIPEGEKRGRWKNEPVEPVGETHHMTTEISHSIREIVQSVRIKGASLAEAAKNYMHLIEGLTPVSIRDYLKLIPGKNRSKTVQNLREITATFSVGQMSYGSLSEVAHRDAMLGAMHAGARSGSGEGGQNPYYYKSGLAPSSQQAASGMFGVDAYYLNRGNSEINIKIAQGAKPGEGGQLMGIKVSKAIAAARGGRAGATLISPPPLHDKYSIEDLARSIREYKQINPEAVIAVKLVASPNIGTIAAGVAKCAADVIEIAGFDGGTGASPLTSMAHAGLPCEYGLAEANRVLISEGLRSSVKLRVSGGLRSAQDIVKLAILGADEFDFGRLPLVAEGCFMMRQCHENVCTAGIATQDPQKIAKYIEESGEDPSVVVMRAEQSRLAMDVSNLFSILAVNVQEILQTLGVASLQALRGRRDLLTADPKLSWYLSSRGLDLSGFCGEALDVPEIKPHRATAVNPINTQIKEAVKNDFYNFINDNSFSSETYSFSIQNKDSSAFTALAGEIARDVHKRFKAYLEAIPPSKRSEFGPESLKEFYAKGVLNFLVTGSAGQGFAMGLCHGLDITLCGEANDAVAQNMSGGKLIIKPEKESIIDPSISPIIGQSAMYGARGGKLFALGIAGDRFAVRNSGAEAVIEGCKKHACEYMINGAVVVLGEVGVNFGAGMSGGIAYLYPKNDHKVNKDTITSKTIAGEDLALLKRMLNEHYVATNSNAAREELQFIEKNGASRMLAYVAYSDLNKNSLFTASAA